MTSLLTRIALAGLTAATLLLPSATTFASSSKIYVDDDKQQCKTAQFSKIQDAVDAAKSGDTIYVCSGAYNAQVMITKPLTLRSQVSNGQSLPLLSNFDDHTRTITVNDTKDVTIRDLRIAGTNFNDGIMVSNSDNVTIQHMSLSNMRIGVFLDTGSDNNTVKDNTMTDVGSGIAVSTNIGAKITGNTISGIANVFSFTEGIQLFRGDKSQVSKNNVTATNIGIFIDESISTVDGNTVTSSTDRGIALIIDSKVTVSNNTVKDSKNIGIEVRESAGVVLKGNKVQNSGTFDAKDFTQGDKTAGTANTWTDNTCKTSDPKGLCK